MRFLRTLVFVAVAVALWLAVGPVALVVALGSLLVPQVRHWVRPTGRVLLGWVAVVGALVAVVLVVPAGRLPLPPGGGALVTPSYVGHAATAQPIELAVPQHPGLAANGRSSMHDDGWATDSYAGPGPLGRDPEVDTAWYGLEECATLAFDSHDRLVALCGNRTGPVLHVLDPDSMRPLETLDLPDRPDSGKRPWEDLCGGAYFFLDAEDRAVLATTDRHVLVVDATDLSVEDRYDLTGVIPDDDCLVSLMPDWQSKTWWVSQDGRVGYVGPGGDPTSLDLGEEVANSVAAGEDGSIYVVTVEALYQLRLDDQRRPEVVWRAPYENGGEHKSGQLSAGSGTTPTVLPSGLVSITDNADPRMHVQFYDTADGHLVCEAPVFGAGESASDNSLVAVGDASVVVENNHGYSSPLSTVLGRITTGGLARVDADAGQCSVAWTSDEVAPTSVAKVSLATGLVYAYTTRHSWWGVSAWYLTAIDARTGETAYSVRTGTGTLFNNHYSAVTLAPDGSAYVATLGGMVRVRDGSG